jgi:diketogulonate reductase-like aldo/keto reductase
VSGLELPAFDVPDDAIDPNRVPRKKLYTGATIPTIGLGTFGSDRNTAAEIASAVVQAAALGYRHFDCAAVYGNEKEIGEAFQVILKAGVPRREMFVTSKVWNDRHHDVVGACEQSLRDLRLEYLDLYLMHWPFPNFHPPGCDVSSRSKDAKPYIHADYIKTWRAMERLVERGLVRHIGTSNMTIPKLELLLRDCAIKPAVNEMELHPHFQQPELYAYVVKHGILPIGYCPVGSPNRPERDRTPEDTSPLEDPVIKGIAARLGVHPAVVCLKWAMQRDGGGQVPIPFSVTRKNYRANLEAAVTAPLTEADMAAIAKVDRNCRFIKGQVFLWKENQSWEDLWDVDGVIRS